MRLGAILLACRAIVSAASSRFTSDQPDEKSGYQVHVMYVVPYDGVDHKYDTDGSLERSVASFQQWLSGQTGGRILRIDTFGGHPDITFLRTQNMDATIASRQDVPAAINAELLAAGFNAPNKIYLVIYDGGKGVGACGQTPVPPAGIASVAVLFLQGTPTGKGLQHELVHIVDHSTGLLRVQHAA